MKHGSRVALEGAAGKKPTACRAVTDHRDSDGINTRIVSKIRSNKLHVTVEIISKVWYRYLNESNTLMRYYDVKLEKKYITIVIVDETRKLERKL